jgi:hypothetical protein
MISTSRRLSIERRLTRFDAATRRQSARDEKRSAATTSERGWKREDLYDRSRVR